MKTLKLLILTALLAVSGSLFSQDLSITSSDFTVGPANCDGATPHWQYTLDITNNSNTEVTYYNVVVTDAVATNTVVFNTAIGPNETYTFFNTSFVFEGDLVFSIESINDQNGALGQFGEDLNSSDNTFTYTISLNEPDCTGPDIIITNVNIIDEGCVVINNFIWSYQELEVTLSNIGTEPFTAPYSVTSELAFSGEYITAQGASISLLQPGESIVLTGSLNSINTAWSVGQSNILTASLGGQSVETGGALLNNTYEIFQTEDVDCSDLSIIDVELTGEYAPVGCNPSYLQQAVTVQTIPANDSITSLCINFETLNTNTNDTYTVEQCYDASILPFFSTDGTTNITSGSFTIPIDGDTYNVTVYIDDVIDLDGNQANDTITYTVDTSIYDYDNCIYGCTDPAATNYDSTADVDDGSCNYTILDLNYLSSVCSVDCDDTGAFYYVTSTFQNTGNAAITDFCAEWNIIGGEQEVECFTGDLQPNATATITHGPIYTDGSGAGYIYIQSLNGATLNPELNFLVSLSCISDAEAACVYGCTDNTACNFDAAVDFDDGSCTYVDEVCETCENGVIVDNDTDNDGVCDSDEIDGCTDETACNYNSNATDDDNTCTFATGCDFCSGETDGTGTVIDGDTDNDGVCNDAEIPGCTDVTACNYDETATDEDNSCTFVDGVCDTCVDGQVIDNDEDNDGVCDDDETIGCTDPNACNVGVFTNTDNTLCTYPDGVCETCVDGSIIDNDVDNDGVCDDDEVPGCTDVTACNYDANATDEDNSCTFPDGVCETCVGGVIVDNDDDNDGVCNANEVTGCTNPTACNYDDDPTTDTDNTLCTFAIGCDTCSGETDGTGTVIDGDTDDDGVCNDNEVPGCTDSAGCNWNVYATEDDGSCIYPDGVCEICNYGDAVPIGNGFVMTLDDDNDGVCNDDEIVGCQDQAACNYDATATDAGDCIFPPGPCDVCDGFGGVVFGDLDGDGICDDAEVLGCTDVTACNYDTNATEDDGSCVANLTCVNGETFDCNGNPVGCQDTDGDGVCDVCEIPGCNVEFACNYNAAATDDDGTCDFTTCAGCMNATACNYDPTATLANLEVCDYSCYGCMDPLACNYDPNATLPWNGIVLGDNGPGACAYAQPGFDCECAILCLGDFNFDGLISTADLLLFLAAFGEDCE